MLQVINRKSFNVFWIVTCLFLGSTAAEADAIKRAPYQPEGKRVGLICLRCQKEFYIDDAHLFADKASCPYCKHNSFLKSAKLQYDVKQRRLKNLEQELAFQKNWADLWEGVGTLGLLALGVYIEIENQKAYNVKRNQEYANSYYLTFLQSYNELIKPEKSSSPINYQRSPINMSNNHGHISDSLTTNKEINSRVYFSGDGVSTHYSDGSNSISSGDTTYFSDGSSAIQIDETTYFSDGSSTIKSGDTYHFSNGEYAISNGDKISFSDGSFSTIVDDRIYDSSGYSAVGIK